MSIVEQIKQLTMRYADGKITIEELWELIDELLKRHEPVSRYRNRISIPISN